MFRNESYGGGKGRTLIIAVAVIVPACLAGGLVYHAVGDSGGSEQDSAVRAAPTSSPSASPTSAVTGDDDQKGSAPQADLAGTAPTAQATASPRPLNTTGAKRPLAGKVVVLDPGHNLNNAKHTAEINKLVNIGTARKECDTTGTETNSGYAEATYTLDVAHRVRAILLARGAQVKLTYDGDRAFGPCVDERARIGNAAHADAALSIHADGAPASASGFHVIAPKSVHVGIADTRKIAAPSYLLATTLRSRFAAATGEHFADYLGGGTGMTVRDDLGGLNLSTVPKVFIECGNMRNAHDAKSLTDSAWRQHAAQGIADGLTAFLEGKR
ncbi:N-acetylmuramoyl-L-alanine amidase [Streptomyces sp. NPDC008139]|uniref:N-acetylmuramoyl-L-alanine amidase n=1 Tax=Streptomyces sp. NPDC008139 TaxID=3364814 RepID=UPI0036EF6A14